MLEISEAVVMSRQQNETLDAPKGKPVSDERKDAFAMKLSAYSLAYENYCNMLPSVQRTYTMRYLSFKYEETRQRDSGKIVDRLNNNLKPM
jgi:hypothetical protein